MPKADSPDQSAPSSPSVATAACSGNHRPKKKSTKTRWRVFALVMVHVLFIIHLIHWKVAEKTLSPVEPSESMFFIERGELNAGVIFFAVAILATLVFGRFFCGWGCHVVALQDLCAAGMKRIGIRPKAFRARLLRWVPAIVAFEMFIFPFLKQRVLNPLIDDIDWRVWFDGLILPANFEWAVSDHLMTEDFWATFVGPAIAIPFLLICGFGVVYFLGSKGFCMYGCPYGAFFSGADRFSPGRIVANLDTCEKCGECTAQCTSNVRVHEEIRDWNKVVSSDCMKCLDCVSVCPTGSLSYGFAQPLVFSKTLTGKAPKKKRFDLTFREEIVLFILFFAVRYSWRGVWALVPMLMATGIAGCITFMAWKGYRTLRDRDVSLHKFALKRGGEIQGAGKVMVAIASLLLVFTAYLGVIKWNQEQADWQYQRLFARNASLDVFFAQEQPQVSEEVREIAARGARNQSRLLTFGQGGLSVLPQPWEKASDPRLGYFRVFAGDLEGAKVAWERALEEGNHTGLVDVYVPLVFRLAVDQFRAGNLDGAIAIMREGLENHDESPFLAHRLSLFLREAGQTDEADRWLKRADELMAELRRRQGLPPTPPPTSP